MYTPNLVSILFYDQPLSILKFDDVMPTSRMNDVKTKYISYLYLFQHEMFTPGTNGQFYRLLNMLNKPVSFSECG